MKPVREAHSSPTELGRLFEEALRCLNSTDLPGANAALKKAYDEVVSPAGHGEKKESEDRG